MDVVGDDGLDQFVDVEELEAGEQRVPLVDLGVADVDVAVGGKLLLHFVEVVLAADELRFDSVASRIADKPFQFPEIGFGTRRALLRRFPYAIYFIVDSKPTIVAVLHQRGLLSQRL